MSIRFDTVVFVRRKKQSRLAPEAVHVLEKWLVNNFEKPCENFFFNFRR